eukprot:scaffold11689_cov131-Cylindrotheca_fusiformis.AAC.4
MRLKGCQVEEVYVYACRKRNITVHNIICSMKGRTEAGVGILWASVVHPFTSKYLDLQWKRIKQQDGSFENKTSYTRAPNCHGDPFNGLKKAQANPQSCPTCMCSESGSSPTILKVHPRFWKLASESESLKVVKDECGQQSAAKQE